MTWLNPLDDARMRPLAVSTTSQASSQTVLKFLGEVFMAHELSVKDIGGLIQPTTLCK